MHSLPKLVVVIFFISKKKKTLEEQIKYTPDSHKRLWYQRPRGFILSEPWSAASPPLLYLIPLSSLLLP